MKRIRPSAMLFLATAVLLAPLAHAQVTQTEVQKLLADDAEFGDQFGYSVAIDGDTALIGDYFKDDSGTERVGAAYVFTRSAGTWTQQAKLLANDKARNDRFGRSVAIDGDTAVIGAYTESDSGTNQNGAVYVFTRTAGTWSQHEGARAASRRAAARSSPTRSRCFDGSSSSRATAA